MQQTSHDSEADADLLVRYRDGDCGAFRRLVDDYQARLVQFFFRLCWDRDRAEDLTQELFLKLMHGCRRYRPAGKLSTFVFRVATNLWIWVALIGSLLFLLAVEFLNTAIERLCNHVQPELHAAIRVTKDLGSAAVFFAITLAALIWIVALLARFWF